MLIRSPLYADWIHGLRLVSCGYPSFISCALFGAASPVLRIRSLLLQVHRLSDLLIGVGVVGIPGLFALLAPDAFASSLGSVLSLARFTNCILCLLG